MDFDGLTWTPDQLAADGVTMMGWQAFYTAPNDYNLVINTTIGEEAPATATEPAQTYVCRAWSWSRADGDTTPYLEELNCTSARVTAIMREIDALDGRPTTTTTTAAPSGPAAQWD